MKSLKRLMALLLVAITLIAYVPSLGTVSAAGTAATGITLDAATVLEDSANKTLLFHFSESAKVVAARIRLWIVNNTTDYTVQTFVDGTTKSLEWTGVPNYARDGAMEWVLNNSLKVGGVDVDTFDEIFALVAPGAAYEGCQVVVCLREYVGTGVLLIDNNGRIESVYGGPATPDMAITLVGNHVSGSADEVIIPVQQTTNITLDKAVAVGPKKLNVYFSAPAVRNRGGSMLICIVNDSYAVQSYAGASRALYWTCSPGYSNYPASPMTATMTDSVTVDGVVVDTVDEIMALVAPGGQMEGKKAMFCLRESATLTATPVLPDPPVVRTASNLLVDTYFMSNASGSSYYPLRSVKATNTHSSGCDQVWAPIVASSVTLDSAVSYGSKLVLSFSENITKTDGLFAGSVCIVNGSGAVMTNESQPCSWPVSFAAGNTSYYGNSNGNRLIGTLSGKTIPEIRTLAASLGGTVKLCLADAGTAMKNTQIIEGIRSADADEPLLGTVAAAASTYDKVYVDVTDVTETISVTDVSVTGPNQLEVKFSRPINLTGYVPKSELNFYIGLRVVDDSNDLLYYNGTNPYQWGVALAPTADPLVYTGTVSGSAAGASTINDIRVLTETGGALEGKDVVLAFEQKIVSGTGDIPGVVDNVNADDNSLAKLADNRPNTSVDRHYFKLSFTGTSARPELVSAVMTSATEIIATFSKPVNIPHGLFVGVRMVNTDSELVYDGTTPLQWYSATGSGDSAGGAAWEWVDDTHTQIRWTLRSGNTKNIDSLYRLLNKDGLESFTGDIMFCLEEKSQTAAGFTANGANNAIDNISAADNYLKLKATYNVAGKYNAVYMPITMGSGISVTPPTLVSAEAISPTEIVATFSEPVSIPKGMFVGIRLVDAANELVYDNSGSTPVPMQWYSATGSGVSAGGSAWEWYDDDHTQIKWTLAPSNTKGITSIVQLLTFDRIESFNDSTKFLKFCIQEKAQTGFALNTNNNRIENVVSVATGLGVTADYNVTPNPNAAYVDIDLGAGLSTTPPTLVSAVAISETEIVATFSEPVSINYGPFMGIRLVDDDNVLVYDGAGGTGTPMQWYPEIIDHVCQWEWYDAAHTQIKWTLTSNNTYGLSGISQILAYEGFTSFNTYSLRFGFEEQDRTGFAANRNNDLVDSITSASGIGITANCADTTKPDAAYVAITLDAGFVPGDYREPELLSAVAINDTQVVATFSMPVDILRGPFVGLRLVDANDVLVWDGGSYGTGNPMQWLSANAAEGSSWEWNNTEHTEIIWTLKSPNTYGITSLSRLLNFDGLSAFSSYTLKFGIEEKGRTGFDINGANDRVDNVVSANGIGLNKTCGDDTKPESAYVPVTFSPSFDAATLNATGVYQIDESSLVIAFSAPVQADIAEGFHNSIRLVDDSNNLIWRGAVNTGTPLQWYGSCEWYNAEHTQIKWTIRSNNTLGISNLTQLFAYRGLEAYTNRHLRFCIEERPITGVDTSSNGFIDNIALASKPAKHLSANKAGMRDGLYLPITESGYNHTPLGVRDIEIIDDVHMKVNFTEAVEIRGDLWTGLRIVDANSRLQTYKEGTDHLQWKMRWTYTDASHTSIMCMLDAPGKLGAKSIADVMLYRDRIAPFKSDDLKLVFCIEEKSGDNFEITSSNGLVDSIKGANRIKCADATPYLAGWNDGIYTDISGLTPLTTRLTMVSAEVISSKEIVVTFSAPVSLDYTNFAGIRMVDSNNYDTLQWTGGSWNKGTPIQWSGKLKYYDESHTKVLFTLNGNQKPVLGVITIFDILNRKDFPEKYKDFDLKFCIEEKGAVYENVRSNNVLDSITLAADKRIHLTGNKSSANSYDGVYLPITYDKEALNIEPMNSWAYILNDRQLVISFPTSVRVGGNPFMGIRYIKGGNLVWTGETNKTTPVQFYGTWEYYDDAHTQILWTMNGGNTYGANNIFDVVNYAGGLIAFDDATIVMGIEENGKYDFNDKLAFNGLVDNIISWNGARHLAPTGGNGNDYRFIYLDTAPLLTDPLTVERVQALDDMTIEIQFSAPVKIADDESAPEFAIRYLSESGDTDVAVDGRLSIFRGDWEWKDNKHDTIVWTLDVANAHGAKNLSDIFNYEGDLKFSEGSQIAFCITPVEETMLKTWTMRIDGITDLDGMHTLSATKATEFPMVQKEVELLYELPAPDGEEEVVETGGEPIVEKKIISNYLPAILIGGGLAVAGGTAATIVGLKRRGRRSGK